LVDGGNVRSKLFVLAATAAVAAPLFVFPTILDVVLALPWRNYHLVNCLSRTATNPTHRESRTLNTFSKSDEEGGARKMGGGGRGQICSIRPVNIHGIALACICMNIHLIMDLALTELIKL